MAINITKGITQTVRVSFRDAPAFGTLPTFEVLNSDNDVIATGLVSVVSATVFEAQFVVPTSYTSPNGDESLTLDVYGTDSNNKLRSREVEMSLLDAVDSFENFGLVLPNDGVSVTDKFLMDSADYADTTLIRVSVYDNQNTLVSGPFYPSAVTLERAINLSDVPDRFTEADFQGYMYSVKIPSLTLNTPFYHYYNIQYSFYETSALVNLVTRIRRPVYPISGVMYNALIQLRAYLDKARLIEIDKTLQWHDDELIHALFEGAQYINNHPSSITYWTVDAYPQAMIKWWTYAAAFEALNTRYLAEGLNSFQFSGLSTTLEYDRKEAIAYKIEEIKAMLEANLDKAKTSAVRAVGIGTPQNEELVGANNIAVVGLTYNPTNNFVRPQRYRGGAGLTRLR